MDNRTREYLARMDAHARHYADVVTAPLLRGEHLSRMCRYAALAKRRQVNAERRTR